MIRTSQQVRQFVQESGISLKEFKSLTGLSSSQVMAWCAGEDRIFKEKHLRSLERGLGTTLENLNNKKFLNKCFFENVRGEQITVSERYVESARSFVRSSSHIVKYLELLFGRERIKFILKEMDVHRAYLDELDNRINILFFVDLLEECRQLGLAKGDLRKLASAMFLSIEGTASEKLFRPCAFHCEAYKNIGEIVNLFDTNFYYDFKVTDQSVEISAEPHESIVPLLEKIPVDYLFSYRKQIFGTVPMFCGLDGIHLDLADGLKESSLKQVYKGQFTELPSRRKLSLVQNKGVESLV